MVSLSSGTTRTAMPVSFCRIGTQPLVEAKLPLAVPGVPITSRRGQSNFSCASAAPERPSITAIGPSMPANLYPDRLIISPPSHYLHIVRPHLPVGAPGFLIRRIFPDECQDTGLPLRKSIISRHRKPSFPNRQL